MDINIDIRKTRTCEKCKTVVPLEKVRLYPRDAERNWLICDNCCVEMKTAAHSKLSNMPKKIVKDPIKNIAKPVGTMPLNKKVEVKVKAAAAADEMVEGMFCKRCRYSFKINTDRVGVFSNLCCPYCGKDDQLSHLGI